EYILQQKNRGIGGTRIFETELYRRSSEPVSIFVLTLIGMALASRKVRGGIGLHLAIGISLGAIFIVLSRFTMTFTNAESLGPVVGVWLPNIVFFLISLVLIRYAQK
ncbi:MAG: LptF/LptG family permease, partial [Saprospiraceae bacterium]|nr:LptF/LptG family permease [Saprospiraceae bacterium]